MAYALVDMEVARTTALFHAITVKLDPGNWRQIVRKSGTDGVTPNARYGGYSVCPAFPSIAIERQIGALNAIRYQRCVRPELRDFLVFPGEVKLPDVSSEERVFFNQKLSPDKKKAVLAALGTSDILLVEGPPGTGKTTFITEVILQTLTDNPNARILLTSQTHVALDHVIGAVQKTGNPIATIRIGRLGDPRISTVAEEFLLENKMESWRCQALETGRAYLQQLGERVNISLASIKAVIHVKRI